MAAKIDRTDSPALLSPGDVAKELSIGVRTLWRWVSDGTFPKADLRVGTRVVRWKAGTVSTWIESNSVTK